MIRKALKRLVRFIQEFLERHLLGNRLQEWTWRLRHLYRKNWAENYLASTNHPHRDQIVQSVLAFKDVNSVLEIGCASGANLIRLRTALPEAQFIGVDINQQGIRTASEYFDSKGYKNVNFFVGRADKLSDIKDRSIDVVLADAVLMFITPDRIEKVLSEMIRIAKKGVVLNEYHKDRELNGYFNGGRWIYDLSALLKKQLPDAVIHISKSTFIGGAWDDYGSLIEVRL